MSMKLIVAIVAGMAAIVSCAPRGGENVDKKYPTPEPSAAPETATEALATFGGGCFWCTEAVFLELKGVKKVVSGYTGGTVKNPTYDQVCKGNTGHAEAIQITYDPRVVRYDDLLLIFWKTHDPTTLNKQGPDKGTQYRSAVFYHTPEQKALAEHYKKKIDDAQVYSKPIVTEIVPIGEFYPAEDYHQNFYARNPQQGYCNAIIPAKLEKLREAFADKVK